MQGLNVVLHVRTLAADVEVSVPQFKLVVVSKDDQIYGVSRQGAKLATQFYHRPGVGYARP